MNKEKIKFPLWKTESKNGKNYYKGKIKIREKEYNIALFKNEKKQDKSPDLMLYIDEKNEDYKKSYTVDEVVYDENFGKDTENVSDEDLAF